MFGPLIHAIKCLQAESVIWSLHRYSKEKIDQCQLQWYLGQFLRAPAGPGRFLGLTRVKGMKSAHALLTWIHAMTGFIYSICWRYFLRVPFRFCHLSRMLCKLHRTTINIDKMFCKQSNHVFSLLFTSGNVNWIFKYCKCKKRSLLAECYVVTFDYWDRLF